MQVYGGFSMAEVHIIRDDKVCPSEELFNGLLLFLLLNTGKPLTDLAIMNGLKKTFNIEASNKTVRKYINYMVDEGKFVDCVKREYVKPHFTRKDQEDDEKLKLSFHKYYYLVCSEEELKSSFKELKERLLSNRKSVPTAKWIFARINFYKSLKQIFNKVAAGEILYFQRIEKVKIIKNTIPVDFLVTQNDGKRLIFICYQQTNKFAQKKDITLDKLNSALDSLTEFAKDDIVFVGFHDKEPEDFETFASKFKGVKWANYTEFTTISE